MAIFNGDPQGDSKLTGTKNDDAFFAFGDDNLLKGLAGDDDLDVSSDADALDNTLVGGGGKDTLEVSVQSVGPVTVRGNTLSGGGARDDLDIKVTQSDGGADVFSNTLNGGGGGDDLEIDVQSTADATVRKNTFIGGDGDGVDALSVNVQSDGVADVYSNTLKGLGGNDTLEVRAISADDALVHANNLVGGGGKDQLSVNAQSDATVDVYSNTLNGGGGSDVLGIDVQGGVDAKVHGNSFVGGGGTGKDKLSIDVQSDATAEVYSNKFKGGEGNDTVDVDVISTGDATVNGNNLAGEAGVDSLSINVQSDAGADVFSNTLSGGGGADTLELIASGVSGGLTGNTLNGGKGADNLIVQTVDSQTVQEALDLNVFKGAGGSDTLKILDGGVIDGAGGVVSIEVLDVRNGEYNALSLDGSAVIAMTATDNRLRLLTEAGDTVDLSDWTYKKAIAGGYKLFISNVPGKGKAFLEVKDMPVAEADVGSTGENTSQDFDVLVNDTEINGGAPQSVFALDSVSITSTSGLSGSPAAAGAVSIVGDQVRFDPGSSFDELDAGDSATVVVNYIMSNGNGVSSASTLTLTVTGVNDGPVALADTANATENGTTDYDVLANDTDVDGDDSPVNFSLDSVSITSTTGLSGSPAAAGSVSIVAGQVRFDPGTAFDELDDGDTATVVVDYTMSDDSGEPSSSTLTLTVTGVNDAPVAVVDAAGTAENGTNDFDVLANDTDADGDDSPVNFSLDSVSIASTTGLSGSPSTAGSVSIVGGQVRFDPGTAFDELDGGDTATVVVDYTMSNGSGEPSSSTLTLTVTGVNDGPVAVADTANVTENGTTDYDVLANDTDVDGGDSPVNFSLDSVSIASTTGLSGSPAAAGAVSIVGGQVRFDPGTAFDELDVGDTATVVVDYTMSDDSGVPSASTLTLTVTGVNDAPVAVVDTANATENGTTDYDVLANDTDADGDDSPVNFSLDSVGITSTTGLSGSPAAAGAVSIVGGQVRFDPGTAFDELDEGDSSTVVVNYTVSDDSGATSSSILTLTVTGANDIPVITSNGGGTSASINLDENTTGVTTAVVDDPDTDDTLIYSLNGGADQAFFEIDGSGNLSFLSAPDFEDPTDFDGDNVYEVEIKVTDSEGATDTQSLSVTVDDVGDEFELSALDGSDGFVIYGVDGGDQSGWSVSSAGDVNGDGFDDLLIGACLGDGSGNGTLDAGESYVVFGKASGWGSSVDLSGLDGSDGFVLYGVDEADSSGVSVSSAGDLNGDGFDDLLIGAMSGDGYGNAAVNSGESYVVFGKAGGWAASVDLSALGGSDGYVLYGVDGVDGSGLSVSGAGDVNGDGLDDLLIGAWRSSGSGNGMAYAGESYVVFGKANAGGGLWI